MRWCPARSRPAAFVADPALARHIPLGRLGQADDLAPMALAVLVAQALRLRQPAHRSSSMAACR